MELEAAPAPRQGSWRAVRRLAGGSALALLALLALVLLHAKTGEGALVPAAEAASLAFTTLALGAAGCAAYVAWTTRPQHRGAILLIVVITAAALGAHAFAAGNPPAYNAKTASGPVGTTFSGGDVNVSSQVEGSVLTVRVTAQSQYSSGSVQCCTIADPVLVDSSGALAGKGFASPPTLSSPLHPGTTAVGTWTLTRPITSLNLTYDSLSCYSVVHQEYGCIMDEIYYVPEGMGILAGQSCSTAPSAPPNCHMEHPPLSAALIAAGMAILGEYNAAGWRLFPALLGSLCLPLLFGIAWKLSGNKRLALVAAGLLAIDVMFFTQSGGALLDVPQVFFGLAAFLAFLVDVRWWKFDRYVVSGVLLGLAGLSKETGIFLVMVLVTYILAFERGPWRGRVYGTLKVVVLVGLVFAAGVQAYDSTLAPAVPTFLSQVSYILSYGSGLNSGCPWSCGWTNAALGGYITPFDWVLYYSPVGYYVTNVSTCSGGSCATYVAVGYYGVTNFIETWAVFVWVPLVVVELVRHRRSGKPPADPSQEPLLPPEELHGDARLGAFALAFFFWTYVPYIPLFLAGRVTYPFYFVPAIPALALGVAWWVTRDYFPRWLLAFYLAMAFAFFFIYFPDKSFLPVWVRILLRH